QPLSAKPLHPKRESDFTPNGNPLIPTFATGLLAFLMISCAIGAARRAARLPRLLTNRTRFASDTAVKQD
ncbi:hypothetical protein, partial [Porphyrobacter sp. TH134]|uniref:hypothetical protein n=1 Tax=Porphyrobacter sp. TH134 TaxID=2067450 RepID=UPI001F3420EF